MPGTISILKKTAAAVLPDPIYAALVRYRERQYLKDKVTRYTKGGSTQEIFSRIYSERAWGESGDPDDQFYSGEGSREAQVVNPYVQAIHQFLLALDKKPDVVDLGCGDFYVGSKVRELCGRYIACDIVPPLIEFNKTKYQSLDVDFRVLDLTRDDLPTADVLFIRQVLQHLSNKDIKRVLPQIAKKFKYLVLTEHLPATGTFVPNLDVPTGPLFRADIGSGIVLTRKPFNLKVKEETILCEVPQMEAVIRTTLYKLN
jgi:SAM-dependent methyltransferase